VTAGELRLTLFQETGPFDVDRTGRKQPSVPLEDELRRGAAGDNSE
jgi:hypothetical protein